MPFITDWNLTRARRCGVAVAFIGGLGWALAPAPWSSRLGVVSVVAGLMTALIGEAIDWIRARDKRPREITTPQLADFFRFVGNISKMASIRVTSVPGDKEANEFADVLADTIRAGGWTVDRRFDTPIPTDVTREGITLRARSVTSTSITMLREGFREAGIAVRTISIQPNGDFDEVFVGSKPKR